ncbi:hypothetical protein [Planctomicrobium piriforme]|uniref:Uncharacterized protein n=1 Tax=Planctomicrobium piriforme TaxID=1576369 RepID=A0A1I3RFH7_9PLAN|nr:hypothetical protein [Planctomicrobium piriforme]SFJ44459.1 hypothetical protein SAMN05421753_120101 [Planctomicrobium piriforme]
MSQQQDQKRAQGQSGNQLNQSCGTGNKAGQQQHSQGTKGEGECCNEQQQPGQKQRQISQPGSSQNR